MPPSRHGHSFWPRGFRNLSSFATSLFCHQFAQIGRSDLLGGLPACLRMPCLMHGWGLLMRGGLPPLWGGSFLPTRADIPPHTWEISLTRKTGHPLQVGAPLSRSQRTSRATCWHQPAWRWKHDPSCTVPKDQTLRLQTKFSHIFVSF